MSEIATDQAERSRSTVTDAKFVSGRARVAAIAAPRGGRRWHQDARRRRLLALADLAAGAIAAAAIVVPATGDGWALLLAPLWLLVAKLIGLYDRDHRALRHLTSDEIPQLAAWALVVTVLLEISLTFTSVGALGPGAAIAHGVVAVAAAAATRSLARWAWWKRTPPELVVMVGDDPTLGQMRRKLGLFPDMNFQLAAERRLDDLGEGEERASELNRLADGVDRILLAAGGVEAELIGQLCTLCRIRQVKLSVVSPFRGLALPAPQITKLADLPVLEYNTWDRSRSSLLLKRLVDIAVAGPLLLLLAPLFPLLALAIKLDSRGPVVFSQVRAGFGGRPFRMYKLRTMRRDAEASLDEYVDFGELEEPAFKLADDPRVTRAGRILRRLSIDELPQMVNVLVGEMSLVGPRPEQVELVDRYQPEHRVRLTVKPGVTGPMQIFGRGELAFSERMAVELEYVENQSFSRDLGIIIRTLPAIVRGTGAS